MSLRVQAMPVERLSWLTSRSGCAFTNTLRGIEAIDEHGRVHGAIGFDGWMGNAAQMHIALDNPASLRSLLRPAFHYLFNQVGKDVAIGLIPAHNHRSIGLSTSAGFHETYRLKDGAAPGDDMVLLEMRKEDCRWI